MFAPLALASSQPPVARTAALIYAAGSIVCHQRPDRSFHIYGHQLAVCARCTGLYASALAGGVITLLFGAASTSSSRARGWLGVAAIPTVLTVVLELAGVAHPSNTTRLIS